MSSRELSYFINDIYNMIFQSYCGLTDMIFFLCQIVKVQEKNQEHFIVIISFIKAFDPVN